MSTTIELDELKTAHRDTWASGDYAAVAEALVIEVAEAAVAAAEPQPGETVLDVATGSGNAAIPAALAGAQVTGLDLVPSLLDVGRRRARESGVEIEWVEGDAERLPFPDASFDKVLSVLGVQFAPHHELAAQELARVVRPGGAIALSNWTPQGFIGQFFKTIGPRLPKPPAGTSPPPLWGDEEHVRALFAGSAIELSFERRTVLFEHRSPDAFVAFMAENYGPLVKARERLAPQGVWSELRADLVALSERSNLATDGFLTPSEYLLIRGVHRA